MALRSAENSILGPIYFISLVACNRFGFAEKYKFIYDVLSKEYDFNGTNVKFIDVGDLWDFYKSHNPKAVKSKCDVLLLSEYFMKMHPNSSFILDEVPSPKRRDQIKSKKFLIQCLN